MVVKAGVLQNDPVCALPEAKTPTRVRRKRRGMDPRVYASATLPLRPRMTKGGRSIANKPPEWKGDIAFQTSGRDSL
jgi:hypothetical protein